VASRELASESQDFALLGKTMIVAKCLSTRAKLFGLLQSIPHSESGSGSRPIRSVKIPNQFNH
jgi:hypothetical protein